MGANLGNKRQTFLMAIADIQSEIGGISAVSQFHETAPLNHPDSPTLEQPSYLNAVLSCRTTLSPQEILRKTQSIEKKYGRDRNNEIRWGPRTLDIDIIAIDDFAIKAPGLIIPHPEMHNRSFVLVPMLEISPAWKHPILHKTLNELLTLQTPTNG